MPPIREGSSCRDPGCVRQHDRSVSFSWRPFWPSSSRVSALSPAVAQPPASFDLRDVDGVNYVTAVKSQQGGTCWTHGTMAAMESNLLMTGAWALDGRDRRAEPGRVPPRLVERLQPAQQRRPRPSRRRRSDVHEGGDYRVPSAYLSRGEGAVRDIDGQSYATPPLRHDCQLPLLLPPRHRLVRRRRRPREHRRLEDRDHDPRGHRHLHGLQRRSSSSPTTTTTSRPTSTRTPITPSRSSAGTTPT